jgi:hypothetical protein
MRAAFAIRSGASRPWSLARMAAVMSSEIFFIKDIKYSCVTSRAPLTNR